MAALTSLATASTPLAQAPLAPHDPILINGNAQFTPENGVTGGSGTSVDPYIIEGWEIAGAPGAGIELVATDAHVVIRNVRVLASQRGVLFSSIVSNARIEESEFLDNTLDGIRVYGREIMIRRNTVSSNRTGIYAYGIGLGSSGLVITENDLVQNETGIFLDTVSDALVYHNNMLNNGGRPGQFQARNSQGSNLWDDGYPNGGNYWTDYLGIDVCSGPLQDQCPQPDGIGDTPYEIIRASDRYPLIVLPGSENDTVPPTVSIQFPQDGDVFQDIVVSGIATDGESGIRRVEVRLNGGEWRLAPGTTEWSLPVLLELGENTLEARSWDHAGNISEVDAVTVHAATRWSVEVRTDLPAYLPGQDVRIDVLLSNISDETASLVFGGCVVYFTIESLEGQVLFDERRHRSCVAVVSTLTVEAGQTQIFSHFIWSQVDDAGNPVQLPSQFIVLGAMENPSPPTPSDTTVIAVGHTCEDGIDNDLDGLIDYPADPGCTGPEDDREGGEIRDLSVSVRTDQTGYFSGEPVEIEVAVTNTGTETVALEFPTSCQAFFTVGSYDFELIVYYDLRRHIECPQVLTSLTLEPGQTEIYPFTWNQQDNAGAQVPTPDIYIVEGALGYPEPLLRGSAQIAIAPECRDGIDNDGDELVDYPEDPGCADPADQNEEDFFGVVEVGVQTDQEVYFPEEEVLVDVALTNVGEERIILVFYCADPEAQIGFIVEDHQGELLFDSTDTDCQGAIRLIHLQPGQTEIFARSWAQVDQSGQLVPSPADLIISSRVNSNEGVPVDSTGILIGPACHDGRDNDLDGPIDHPDDSGCAGLGDNDETPPIDLRISGSRLGWSEIPEAHAYDVVAGDLTRLNRSGGDFSEAVVACVADDHPANELLFEQEGPEPGSGFWILVRSVHAGGTGTYDSGSGSQVGSRDAGIDAAPLKCP